MDSSEEKRRKFEQQTHSGTSSAGSMGAGGTGHSGKAGSSGQADAGNSQSGTRTDDLLSGGVSEQQRAEGFQRDCKEEDLRERLESGKGKQGGGNRP